MWPKSMRKLISIENGPEHCIIWGGLQKYGDTALIFIRIIPHLKLIQCDYSHEQIAMA